MEKENNKLEIQKPFSKIPFLSYLGALASILISIIGPIIGIVCGSVAIGISAKEKSIEAKHMMFYNILLDLLPLM